MAKKVKLEKVKPEGFVNPFDPGVNYETFMDSIPEGVSVEDHCKEHLTKEQIEWLIGDLGHYENNSL